MPTISTLSVDVVSNTSRLRVGLAAAGTALAALGGAAIYAFKQFEDSEKVVQQTNAVLESTGHAANVSAHQVDALGNALSAKTGIDDEAIQSGENLLLTFRNIANQAGQGNDIFNQATVAITDLSVAMGQDFKSSAIQLGKALNDPITGMTALRRVGVQFDEEQTHMIEQFVKHNNLLGAQKVILGELTSEFGGSAEAQKTASQTAATALGNLAETIGGLLAPAITVLADGLDTVVSFLQEHAKPAFDHLVETFTNAWNAVKPFAEAIGSVLLPLLETMWNTVKDRLLPVLERIKPVLILIGGAIVLFATLVLAQFALVVTAVSFLVDKFLDFVGFIRDKVVEPVVNFLGRIASFVLDKLRPIWDVVKDAAVSAFHAIIAPIEAVIETVKTLIGWLIKAVEWLGKVIDLGHQASEPTQIGQRGGGIAIHPPEAQTGGFVAQSGLAVIHQGESIIPRGMDMGGGGDIVLQIDGQTFARISRDQLLKLGKRNVTTGIS